MKGKEPKRTESYPPLIINKDSTFSKNDPPAFIMVSEDDSIVNVSIVEKRVKDMQNAGIEVEYHKYKNAGHGFGLGVGTDAEGLIAVIHFQLEIENKGITSEDRARVPIWSNRRSSQPRRAKNRFFPINLVPRGDR